MRNLILILILFSGFTFGQKKVKGEYSVRLVNVESPIKQGSMDLEKINSYKDSIISIRWVYAASQLDFDLNNNSDQTIRINWNDSAIIDIDGRTKKIFHKGIKYIDREKDQTPSVVYKNTSISELISPIENVNYYSGKYGGWATDPIVPIKKNFWNEYVYDEKLVGKKFRAVLPIIIDNKTLDYIFEFEVFFTKN